VFEVARDRVAECAELATVAMSGAYALDVPLVVDVRTGENWDEMSPLALAHA